MRARARLVPDPAGILRDPAAFFRQGVSGTGATVLSRAQLEYYHQRTATLAAPDLRSWLHR